MSGQTKKGSALETISSTAFGFLLAMLIQPPIFAWFGMHIDVIQDFWITVIFTVISNVRGYVFRRAFNKLTMKGIM